MGATVRLAADLMLTANGHPKLQYIELNAEEVHILQCTMILIKSFSSWPQQTWNRVKTITSQEFLNLYQNGVKTEKHPVSSSLKLTNELLTRELSREENGQVGLSWQSILSWIFCIFTCIFQRCSHNNLHAFCTSPAEFLPVHGCGC